MKIYKNQISNQSIYQPKFHDPLSENEMKTKLIVAHALLIRADFSKVNEHSPYGHPYLIQLLTSILLQRREKKKYMLWNLPVFRGLPPRELALMACDDEQGGPFYSAGPHGKLRLSKRRFGENQWNGPGKQNLETKFLALGEVCMAVFWRTPGFEDRTFRSSGFSAEGTLENVS